MARYKPLKLKYNTQVNTEIKDFLPIISNAIPSMRLFLFDNAGVVSVTPYPYMTFTQDAGTAIGGLNYSKAYHGDSCYKITNATNSASHITINYPTAINLLQIGATQIKNYASIKRVMKYGDAKDKAHFILNLQKSSAATTTVIVKVYNGTKLAVSVTQPLDATAATNYNQKLQWGLNNMDFTYGLGFTNADFENITKIEIYFSTNGATAVNYYLHDIYSALPQKTALPTSVAASYYTTKTTASSLYVSSIFGSDAAAGTITAPFKTIEKALTAVTGTFINIIILDSETYKYGQSTVFENCANYVSVAGVLIMADFLETPTMSQKGGLYAPQRCGTRIYRRADISDNINVWVNYGGGNDSTGARNDITKPFKTIQAAVTAASVNDVIEITDSYTYNEAVTIGKNITIQAGSGMLPVLVNISGNTALSITGSGNSITVAGLTIQGNFNASDITTNVAGTNIITFIDCLFTGSGLKSTAVGYCIKADGSVNVYNCLFINNYCYDIKGGGILQALNTKSYDNLFMEINDAGIIHCCDINGFIAIRGGNSSIKTNKLTKIDAENFNGGGMTVYIQNNYFNTITTQVSQNSILIHTHTYAATYIIRHNFFNLGKTDEGTGQNGVTFVTAYNNSETVTLTVEKNTFLGGNAGLSFLSTLRVFLATVTKNYFIKNNIGIRVDTIVSYGGGAGSNSITASYSVFENCVYAEWLRGSAALFFTSLISNNSIYYNCAQKVINAPVIMSGTGKIITSTANFEITPAGNIFILPTSIILNGYNEYQEAINYIIEPTYSITLLWLNFEAGNNSGILRQLATGQTVTVKNCYASEFNFALFLYIGYMSIQNNYFFYNGCGVVFNNTDFIANEVKYNIFKENITGVYIGGGASISNNTIINNGYGVYCLLVGVSNFSDFVSQYIYIKNNIITGSIFYDYFGTAPTNYNVINKRYDAASTGAMDIQAGALLDETFLYPAHITMGYFSTDASYGTASTAAQNIGARYLEVIKSSIGSSIYSFLSAGTGADIWAYENPQKFKYTLNAINLSSTRTLAGDYNANVTGHAREYTLTWGNAGEEGKINLALKTALEAAYMGYWITGLSYDNGVTYTYYKIKKDSSFQSEQQKYLFDTLPEGSASLTLVEIPLFDINAYTVTTGGMT